MLTAAALRVCWAFAVVVTVMRRAVMWWVWLCAVTVLLARGAAACRLGGRISGRMECGVAGSPYTVTQDVEVSRGASLVFRPGVTVMFDPGVGMTVRGTLEAEVRRFHFSSNYFQRPKWRSMRFSRFTVQKGH